MRMRVTKKRIRKDLRNLGLKQGNWVLVHSSLKSIGYVIGGANTVIDAILEVIGDEGLLMVPTFTFTNFTPYFDPRHTPSQMGLITETLRKREESMRSLHPRHSVGVIGKKAEEVVNGHLQAGSVGKGSPIDKLAEQGGYILLLGVDHTSNTIIHTAEVYAELPYLYTVKDSPDFPRQANVLVPNGRGPARMSSVELAPYPTCSEGFWKLEPVLRDRRQIRYGKIGQANCQLMRGKDVIRTVSSLLRQDPIALLCDESPCYPCEKKREFVRRRRQRVLERRLERRKESRMEEQEINR